jgi:hypothetical protein
MITNIWLTSCNFYFCYLRFRKISISAVHMYSRTAHFVKNYANFTIIIQCDHSQKNVMNAHGNFYSAVVVNQPKKIVTINTKQTKYFRSVPQESITGGIIKCKYFHTLFGICLSWIWLLVNLLGVHHPGPLLCKAASGLSLWWLGRRGGEWLGWSRGTSLFHMIPHRQLRPDRAGGDSGPSPAPAPPPLPHS